MMKKIGVVVAICLTIGGTLIAAQKNESKCRHCGSASYGAGCHHSPTNKHRHGPGDGKCIWCGSKSTGAGCHHSPTGKHVK